MINVIYNSKSKENEIELIIYAVITVRETFNVFHIKGNEHQVKNQINELLQWYFKANLSAYLSVFIESCDLISSFELKESINALKNQLKDIVDKPLTEYCWKDVCKIIYDNRKRLFSLLSALDDFEEFEDIEKVKGFMKGAYYNLLETTIKTVKENGNNVFSL